MLAGSLTAQQLQDLEPWYVARYEAGDLFAATFGDVTRWILEDAGRWYVGEALAPLFADAVIAAWESFYPSNPPEWA